MKPTDEQLREIGEAAEKAIYGMPYQNLRSIVAGRAAFEASCKIALAEPTSEELALGWNKAATIGQVMWNDIVREVFANRLRSLTAEPKDEAVEAVQELLNKQYPDCVRARNGNNCVTSHAAEIVAAVRKADAK